MKKPLFALALAVEAALFVWLNYRLMTLVDYPNIDFTNFYAAGRVLGQGGSPYDPAALQVVYDQAGRTFQYRQITSFAYPLWTAFIFVPLGSLPLDWATTTWAIINELLWLATWALLWQAGRAGQTLKPARSELNRFLVIALIFTASRHFVRPLLNGQTSLLTTFLVAVFVYGAACRRYRLAGLGLVAGLLKPTPFLIFLPLALLWLARRRERWPGLLSFVLAGSGLAGLSFLVRPDWLPQWLGVRTEAGWQNIMEISTVLGTTGGLARAGLGPLAWVVGGGLALGLAAGAWRWGRSRGKEFNPALAWGSLAALSIYLTIYALSYESALLAVLGAGIARQTARLNPAHRRLALVGLVVVVLVVPWLLNPLKEPLEEMSAGLFPVSLLVFSWLIAGLAGSGRPDQTGQTLEANPLAEPQPGG